MQAAVVLLSAVMSGLQDRRGRQTGHMNPKGLIAVAHLASEQEPQEALGHGLAALVHLGQLLLQLAAMQAREMREPGWARVLCGQNPLAQMCVALSSHGAAATAWIMHTAYCGEFMTVRCMM